jgi:hypothetical protein
MRRRSICSILHLPFFEKLCYFFCLLLTFCEDDESYDESDDSDAADWDELERRAVEEDKKRELKKRKRGEDEDLSESEEERSKPKKKAKK